MKHSLLKVFLGSSKGVWIEGSSRMKRKKRQKFAIIVAPKAILQENVTRRNKIGKTNSKVLHK
jgi:hypothetical protein